MFSSRTSWNRQPNRLTQLHEERKNSGKRILDLTNSNPTECGILYPEANILSAFSNPSILRYQPDPRGLFSARKAVSVSYAAKKLTVDPSNIFLTASTSEAYSIILKLLCNAGDNVLVPMPSYPLFEYLAQVNDVHLLHYSLRFSNEWYMDPNSIRSAVTDKTKAIVLVHPHNPTGMFLKQSEFHEIVEVAKQHRVALIVDEVFIDYPLRNDTYSVGSTVSEAEVLTFTLNGLSKMCGLPQMKLGWIVVSGQQDMVAEASERLEILCDTFLSVNTPIQVALPTLFETGATIRTSILNRIRSNFSFLQNELRATSCSALPSEGGWHGLVKIPVTKTDEQWAVSLLEKGVYVHPGYFFDLREGFLVVSLLVEEPLFQEGVAILRGSVK
jgi:aspartate/methionine/tyrosine aminotransferase